MRIRRSSAVVVYFFQSKIHVCNFLRRITFTCNTRTLEFLSSLEDWTDIDTVRERFGRFMTPSFHAEIDNLLQLGAIVAEGDLESTKDDEYQANWEWGLISGLYHFGIMDADWVSETVAAKYYKSRKVTNALPSALTTDSDCDRVFRLPEWSTKHDICAVMSARRSKRRFTKAKLQLGELADCLYSGLGIAAIEQDPILGTIPLKMTPSGGARNPYEGYIYVLNVTGLARGIYHYSGSEHTLALVKNDNLPRPSELLGKQVWINKASAVVLLVANFDRTMWKYPHPNGYRAVLIEAGHIAQNILLTAERLKLGAVPTGAVNDTALREALSLKRVTQSVVFAVVIGRPAE